MDSYVNWVLSNPLLSAAIQFAIFGTLGEILSVIIVNKKFKIHGQSYQLFAKILAWALLGVIIKYGFAGMKGFTHALVEQQLLPQIFATGLGWAFAVSVLTNLFFGPQMMFFHRLEDNLILWQWRFDGLKKAWWTLIWFWIPAHTITFSLNTEYQIGLAAFWGMILGIIMGFSKLTSKSEVKSR